MQVFFIELQDECGNYHHAELSALDERMAWNRAEIQWSLMEVVEVSEMPFDNPDAVEFDHIVQAIVPFEILAATRH